MKINKENIILIGFMGCGKTTIGEKLAYKLNYNFVDSDKQLQKEAGISINDIFKLYGENYFRKLENSIINSIAKSKSQVIATGGGIIKNENNIKLLKKSGIILYLKASPEHIYNNIKNDTSRPLLQCEDKLAKIKELLSERENLYQMYCDISIEVSNHSIDNIINQIIGCIY